MAINVKIEETKAKEISFPCLLRGKHSGHVILFTSSDKGVVIVPSIATSELGELFNTAYPATDLDVWEPAPPITLCNA